ncbi:ww domain U1 zinc finger domain-containing protein, putative [Eimeria necatrix]|uniref:Ww domain U1 zinc finger domain-containing protein, putative n=1 Tax=Eimeria necatrix TaxID=51315 RepID=U6MH47_9EIME|nr:ww domain U1 zinc finger domain-containing protein, putative [Eimeria necatrix]CDJ63532.1 ww domain U1 zinc finger domain-containing protein, putative [Eimeria necatrix]
MTERWISQKKHYCQICNTWLSGHIVNVKKHEQSTRHLENARQQLKNAYQRHQDKQKQECLLQRELQRMEAAAAAAMRNDEALVASRSGGQRENLRETTSWACGPSPYEQLQAQREEKNRIQNFHNERNPNRPTATGAKVDGSNSDSSSNIACRSDSWEFVTDQGLPFFRNKISGEVSWTPPPGASYVAAAAAATAAAAAVPAAAAAAATTSAVPARPALRIISVKKPAKKEQPDRSGIVSSSSAAAADDSAARSSVEAPRVASAEVAPSGDAVPSSVAGAPPGSTTSTTAADSPVATTLPAVPAGSLAPSAAAQGSVKAETRDSSSADGVAHGAASGIDFADVPAVSSVGLVPDFIPSGCGDKNGSIPPDYVLKNGHKGVGLYRDRPVQQREHNRCKERQFSSGSRLLHREHLRQQQEAQEHHGQQQHKTTVRLKRTREEQETAPRGPSTGAAAAIAAAAAEAAAAAASLWGDDEVPATAISEEECSNENGIRAEPPAATESVVHKAPHPQGVRESRNRTIEEGESHSLLQEKEETKKAAKAATEENTEAAAAGKQTIRAAEGPTIGPWVEAKEDGWNAIASRQQREQQLLMLHQQQAQEQQEGQQVDDDVARLRRLRAQVKRHGIHHDFSWRKEGEAAYVYNTNSSTDGQGIEIRSRQRPAASRQQMEQTEGAE